MIYVCRWLWVAPPTPPVNGECCCEAEVWLDWWGAEAHGERASVTLSLLGTLPTAARGCWSRGIMPRKGDEWLCSFTLSPNLPHLSLLSVPPPQPLLTLIICWWRMGRSVWSCVSVHVRKCLLEMMKKVKWIHHHFLLYFPLGSSCIFNKLVQRGSFCGTCPQERLH